MLPIVQMGIYPYRQDDWTPEFPEAQVLHTFQGTWKKEIHAKQQNDSGDIKKPRRQGQLYRRAAGICPYANLCVALPRSNAPSQHNLWPLINTVHRCVVRSVPGVHKSI